MVSKLLSTKVTSPTTGRMKEEERLLDINHLPWVHWKDWIYELSKHKYGVQLGTPAAGTFNLNCSYLGIPCIGYNNLNTQKILHPNLSHSNIFFMVPSNKFNLWVGFCESVGLACVTKVPSISQNIVAGLLSVEFM